MATTRVGRYEVFAELGRGGFATVYRAWDPALHREVAIKCLAPYLMGDPSVRARFLAEARQLAAFDHPNLVTVYDVGESADGPFFAMKLVNGQSLEALLAERGRFSLAEAVTALEPIGRALDQLHAAGIVHRDVKPSNVMIEQGGRVILMDLGISRALAATVHTMSGFLVGTPTSMAPEQVCGEPVTAATDIYALGILAYQLLCGGPPFAGDTPYLLHAHAYEAPPDLAVERPDLPIAATDAVMGALAKQPADRPPSASAFVAALARALPLLTPPASPTGPETLLYPANGHVAQAATPPLAERSHLATQPSPPARPRTEPVGQPAPPAARADDSPAPADQLSAAATHEGARAAVAPGTPPDLLTLPYQRTPPPAPAPGSAGPLTGSFAGVPPAPPARRAVPWPLVGGLGAAALVVLAVVALLALRGRSGDRAETATNVTPVVTVPLGIEGATTPLSTITPTATPTPAPRPATAREVRVVDNVFSAREGEIETPAEVTACFSYEPATAPRPLLLLVSQGDAAPTSATDPAVAGRSEGTTLGNGPACLIARAVGERFEPGDYKVGLVEDGALLASGTFRSVAPPPPPTATPAPAAPAVSAPAVPIPAVPTTTRPVVTATRAPVSSAPVQTAPVQQAPVQQAPAPVAPVAPAPVAPAPPAPVATAAPAATPRPINPQPVGTLVPR